MKYKIRDENYQSKSIELLEHVQKILDTYDMPMSVRQIHYRLVSMGLIENTVKEYRMISRLVTKGRYTGHLDWDKIIDETRDTYKTQSWEKIEDSLISRIKSFRFDRWKNNDYYLECWVEKRTMINMFYRITDKYDVRLVSGAGFNSTSAIWDAVSRLALKQDQGKQIKILYFGDLDPSGYFMNQDIGNRIKEFNIELDIERILLNFEDVKKYNLPRAFEVKTKKNGKEYDKIKADPRAKYFIERLGDLFQVEFEALDPDIVVEHVQKAIEKYLDPEDYNNILSQEEKARQEIRVKLRV